MRMMDMTSMALYLLRINWFLEEFEILLLVQEVKHAPFLLYWVDSVAF